MNNLQLFFAPLCVLFNLIGVHGELSSATTISTTEILQIYGSQSFTLTTTLTLPPPTSLANCSTILNALAMLPCISRSTDQTTGLATAISSVNNINPFPHVVLHNTTTATTTALATSIQSSTQTITMTVSEFLSHTTGPAPQYTVTALCLWKDANILTPCTSVIIATSTPQKSAAIPRAANPFKTVSYYIKSIVQARSEHSQASPIACRTSNCSRLPFLWAPLCGLIFAFLHSMVVFVNWDKTDQLRNARQATVVIFWVPLVVIAMYVDYYVEAGAWYRDCFQ